MKVRPLGSRVLVKISEPQEKKTPGGIVLPEGARDEKTVQAEVVSVGSDEKIEVKKGDIVLVPRHSGSDLEMDGEKLLIVKATDILAVVRKK